MMNPLTNPSYVTSSCLGREYSRTDRLQQLTLGGLLVYARLSGLEISAIDGYRRDREAHRGSGTAE